MALTVEIVMPGEKVEFLQVMSVVFQSADGQIGILPGHVAMMCLMDVGLVDVATAEGRRRFVTGDGLARVTGDQVTFLVQELVAEEDIREDEVLRSHEKLSKAVNSLAGAGRQERMKELHFVEAQLALLGVKPPR